MGLISGEMGDKIKQLPFIGIRLERYLAAKARRAQDMEKKLPGTFTAIVMYLLSLWRVAQLRRLMRLSQDRSEKHTSELQSLMRISYAVFCLQKKKYHTVRTSERNP